MFDVVWADPSRELVGQRKARRDIEKKEAETGHHSIRSGESVRSGESTQSKKTHRFLASIRFKKKNKEALQSRLSTSSEGIGNQVQPAQTMPLSSPGLLSRRLESLRDASSSSPQDIYFESCSSSQDRSSLDDSILSKWTTPISLMTMLSLDEGPLTEMGHKGNAAEITSHGQTSTPRAFPTQSPPATPGILQDNVRPQSPLVSSSPSTSHEISPGAPFRLTLTGSTTTWEPLDVCKCSEPPASVMIGPGLSSHSINASKDDGLVSLSLDLSGMQREILQMASASHETFLKRLTEEWGLVSDATLYKELEMEKKRWMMSALYSINPPTRGSGTGVVARADKCVLAFFESQATASYIAALNVGAPVYHMSPSPLSSRLFPNVSPMVASAVPCLSFSVAPLTFSDIHAHMLPVLISAGDIPLVLRNMHRALRPQGQLHLILMDASPVASTIGPRMKAWLDEHLLANVERQFRCKDPTKQFETWLRDAHFQLEEGAKVVCQFAAAGIGETSKEIKETETRETSKRRLHSVVGQKLWQEMWGSYVTARKWWWEDVACREECLRLGTRWEYHLLDASRKSLAPGNGRT